jgi:hypothetical protein
MASSVHMRYLGLQQPELVTSRSRQSSSIVNDCNQALLWKPAFSRFTFAHCGLERGRQLACNKGFIRSPCHKQVSSTNNGQEDSKGDWWHCWRRPLPGLGCFSRRSGSQQKVWKRRRRESKLRASTEDGQEANERPQMNVSFLLDSQHSELRNSCNNCPSICAGFALLKAVSTNSQQSSRSVNKWCCSSLRRMLN